MYSLFLYDSNEHINQPTNEQLIQFLKKIQFIQKNNNTLIPADLFLQLLTFLGCSTNIDPAKAIQISTKITPDIQAIGGNSITKLCCPNCKTTIDKPFLLLKNFSAEKNWHSPCCHKVIPLIDINWRKSAGFSQTFIQINNIFPKEAIPTDEFLFKLSKFSQSSWKYFYSKQQIL